MTPSDLHARMATIVDGLTHPRLTAFRSDFDVIDKEQLEKRWTAESKALWVVREHGTELIMLGLHPRISEWGHAALGLDLPKACFLLTNQGPQPISEADAKRELDTYDWTIADDRISHRGLPIAELASFAIRYVPNPKEHYVANVEFRTLGAKLTHGQAQGLVELAGALAVERSESLFIKPGWIKIDGQKASDVVDNLQEAWLCKELSKPRSQRSGLLK